MTDHVYADALLDDLVLHDLHAICDRTGLSLVEVLDIAAAHLAPDDLRGFEPVVDLSHWDRGASFTVPDPRRWEGQ